MNRINFFSKKMLIIVAVPLLVGVYFFDNIKGHYRFKQYCKNEGGLRVYEFLEKDVGWQAKDYSDAKVASQLEHVGFVRFSDVKGDGKEYDLRYIGGNPQTDESFQKIYSAKLVPVRYEWRHVDEKIHGELRLYLSGYEVYDVSSGKILVRFHRFGYSQFNQEKSILGAPSMVSCHGDKGRDFYDSPLWMKSINTSFE